jgi:hypothetical protein
MLSVLAGLVLQSACKTGETCSFDIIGTWLFNLTWPNAYTSTETLVFSGTSEEGTVSGWSYSPETLGTFRVTVCNVIQMNFDYVDGWDCSIYVYFSGNATSDVFFSGNFLVTNSCFGDLPGSYTATKM